LDGQVLGCQRTATDFFSWMASNATYFMVFNFEIITFDDLTQGSHQVLFDA